MTEVPIIFLNSHRAKSGTLLGRRLPPGYVLACKFFDCGIIDRSHSLDLGFDHRVLDEIPPVPTGATASFGEICRAVAGDLVEEARRTDRRIRLLWSGGIDSTVALVSLLQVLPESEYDRLRIILSMVSIDEYPLFFRRHILNKVPFRLVRPPVTKYFGKDDLIVTGEHGDQLFGSDKLLPLIRNGLAYEKYVDVLPLLLAHKFGKPARVDLLLDYLQPLLAACPVPLHTTFDLFWWLNFSIKWQQVTLRLPVFTFKEDVGGLVDRFRHFFRDARFQEWSLVNHPHRAATGLAHYKWAAKEVIYALTGDEAYRNDKLKQPSLKHVIVDRSAQGNERYRVHMGADYRPVIETFHKQFRNQTISE
jgi:hypothetical protein